MAKQGEGDARWIVKEREDGTNCNGWHWSEVNLTAWSKERLTELLTAVVVFEDSTGVCKITAMDKCTGDVTVQSRKQKKFPLYELEIVLKWSSSNSAPCLDNSPSRSQDRCGFGVGSPKHGISSS